MKYVLFALAVLLLLVGGYSIFTGLPIIEVERGWASVIAGTMAFVGGALLFGIAWVVRTLEQLRAAVLAAEKKGLPAALSPAPRDFRSDEMLNEDRRPLRPEAAAPIAWPPHTSPAAPSANEQEEALRATYASRSERRQEVRRGSPEEVRDEIFEESEEFAAEAESILRTPLTEDDRPVREKPAANIRDFWRRNAKSRRQEKPVQPPLPKKPLGAVASVLEPHPKPMSRRMRRNRNLSTTNLRQRAARPTKAAIGSNRIFRSRRTRRNRILGLTKRQPISMLTKPWAEKHVAPPTAAEAAKPRPKARPKSLPSSGVMKRKGPATPCFPTARSKPNRNAASPGSIPWPN